MLAPDLACSFLRRIFFPNPSDVLLYRLNRRQENQCIEENAEVIDEQTIKIKGITLNPFHLVINANVDKHLDQDIHIVNETKLEKNKNSNGDFLNLNGNKGK